MQIFEYPAYLLPRITYSGQQDSREKPWRNIRRTTDEYILYFVVEGEVFLEEDGIPYHLIPGDLFLLEPGKLHFGTRYTNCVFFYVHFQHTEIAELKISFDGLKKECESAHAAWRTAAENGPFPRETIRIPKLFHVEDRTAISHLSNMFEQLLGRQKFRLEHFNTLGASALTEILIEEERLYARSLFGGYSRGESVSDRLNTVLLYLHTNYHRHITSADIEKEISYNFDYLNQLFARHLHVSIFKLLENIRMEAAKHILETRSLSVKEIAGEVGFSDEAYFSKVFKRRTGYTPTEYRKGKAETDF